MPRVQGVVSGSGGSGDGYTAVLNNNNQPGAWVVTFDTPFTKVPVLLATLANAEANYNFRTRPRTSGFDLEIYADNGRSYVPAAGSFSFSAWGSKN